MIQQWPEHMLSVSVGDPIFGIHSAEFDINGSAAAVNTSQVLGLGSDAGSLDQQLQEPQIWQLTGLMFKILLLKFRMTF